MGIRRTLSMAATIVLAASKSSKACRAFARELVNRGLVASATLFPAPVSVIRSTGEGTEKVVEYLTMLVTDDKVVSNVVDFLKAGPAYQITKVIAVPISGGAWDYLSKVSRMASSNKNLR